MYAEERPGLLCWDTINLDALRKCHVQVLPPTYRLQDGCGNGCYGDPPGFPTYFTRSVYTSHGNGPPHNWPGYSTVILYGGKCYGVQSNRFRHGEDWDTHYARFQALCMRLWAKLPLDHPRTIAWMLSSFGHMQHCYHDETSTDRDQTLIYPVPDYKLKSFIDDPRFSDEWRVQEQKAVALANADIESRAKQIAVWDNHNAVRKIRRYYPEFGTDLHPIPGMDLTVEQLKNGEVGPRPGDWWERFAECPTPANCPGHLGRKHTPGEYCQMCGQESRVKIKKQRA